MDAEKPRIWTDQYRVHWHEAGLNGKARLSSVCNYLQETAGRHADALGFGFEDVSRRNEVWVLIGLMLKMRRFPAWNETIAVETWPKGIERLFAFRDFRILDRHGEVMGSATSTWMILDVKTRRPKPVEIVRPVLHLATHRDVLDENPPLLPHQYGSRELYTRKVMPGEADFNGHVNNTRYIDWCLDACPVEWHRNRIPETLIINYLAEARPGEEIGIFDGQEEKPFSSFHGIRSPDQKVIFRAKLDWI